MKGVALIAEPADPDLSHPDIEQLSQVPLLAALPKAALARLAGELQTQEIPSGQILFREGEVGGRFYVIMAGRMEIVKAMGEPAERVTAVRGPYEFIGEMSLFNRDGLRTASVRCLDSATLKVMTRDQFDELLYEFPTLAYEMIHVLSMRLTNAHQLAMHDLQEKNIALTKAYEELKAAQAQLISKEKLERELQLARQIQMSILPRRLPVLDDYTLGAFIAPARAVGGDFYDYFQLPDHRLGVVIGDVTDKGVPAAIFMARTHALLRAEAQRGNSPVETLKALNQHLVSLNEGGMFVTVLYGILELDSGLFHYARAGHEPPLLYQPGMAVTTLEIKPGMALGMVENIPIDENWIPIPPGGCLLLRTDGITDQNNESGQNFEPEMLDSLVVSLMEPEAVTAQDLCAGIYAALQKFAGIVVQYDDITLAAVARR